MMIHARTISYLHATIRSMTSLSHYSPSPTRLQTWSRLTNTRHSLHSPFFTMTKPSFESNFSYKERGVTIEKTSTFCEFLRLFFERYSCYARQSQNNHRRLTTRLLFLLQSGQKMRQPGATFAASGDARGFLSILRSCLHTNDGITVLLFFASYN